MRPARPASTRLRTAGSRRSVYSISTSKCSRGTSSRARMPCSIVGASPVSVHRSTPLVPGGISAVSGFIRGVILPWTWPRHSLSRVRGCAGTGATHREHRLGQRAQRGADLDARQIVRAEMDPPHHDIQRHPAPGNESTPRCLAAPGTGKAGPEGSDATPEGEAPWLARHSACCSRPRRPGRQPVAGDRPLREDQADVRGRRPPADRSGRGTACLPQALRRRARRHRRLRLGQSRRPQPIPTSP